jgi:uncharacterized membrane protein
MAVGAALMYLLDPNRGARRRSVARDKLVSAVNHTGVSLERAARDLWHRAYGTYAESRHLFDRDEAVDDEVLVARVRSKLGRVVAHPHAIRVAARDGHVSLYGPVFRSEVSRLLDGVARVRGVRTIDSNGLEVHKHAASVPALQGGSGPTGARLGAARDAWSPATRTLLGAAGAALGGYGVARGGAAGAALGAAGAGLLVRCLTNTDTRRLVGAGGGRRAVEVRKTIHIAAPAEEVWSFWSNYDNFPLFMHNVRRVRDHGGGRSTWTVAGPAGVPVEWDALVTQCVPGKVLAWKSVPGSIVAHAGKVEFERNDDGTTRVDVRMGYNPPAGAIGHAVASLFRADPKTEMDQDLMRMKVLIENARFPHDAAKHAGDVAP